MGIEWINKTSKSFRRSMALGRSYILAPSLHDPKIGPIQRSFRVRVSDDREISPGKQVLVRAEAGRVMLLDASERVVGQAEQPPDWLVQHATACPEGLMLGVVEDFNSLGRTADISIQ